MFVIKGVKNSGKTHTAWLVYNLLKEAGTIVYSEFHRDQKEMCYADVIQDIVNSFANSNLAEAHDFRAIMEYMGKKVAIISAGDYVKDETWEVTSFIDSLKWANRYQADYIVCCCRSINRKGSVCRYIMENYKQAVCNWYYKVKTNVLADQINDIKKVAGEVFRDIK